MSSGITTARKSSGQESKTVFSMTHPSSVTFDSSMPSTQVSMLEKWISSLEDSRVSPSQLPVINLARPTNETCGQRQGTPLASYDPDTSSWRTLQGYLPIDMYIESLPSLPRSGTWANGIMCQRSSLEQTTNGNAGGSLLPTPKASKFFNYPKHLWLPTPNASDHRDRGNTDHPAIMRRIRLGKQIGLSMLFAKAPCPLCVEGMMGWPKNWSQASRPLEMGGFRKWWLESFKLMVNDKINS